MFVMLFRVATNQTDTKQNFVGVFVTFGYFRQSPDLIGAFLQLIFVCHSMQSCMSRKVGGSVALQLDNFIAGKMAFGPTRDCPLCSCKSEIIQCNISAI